MVQEQKSQNTGVIIKRSIDYLPRPRGQPEIAQYMNQRSLEHNNQRKIISPTPPPRENAGREHLARTRRARNRERIPLRSIKGRKPHLSSRSQTHTNKKKKGASYPQPQRIFNAFQRLYLTLILLISKKHHLDNRSRLMLEPLPCRNAQKCLDVSGISRYRGSQIRLTKRVASRLPKNQHKRREEARETYINSPLQGSTTGNQIGNDNPKLRRHL